MEALVKVADVIGEPRSVPNAAPRAIGLEALLSRFARTMKRRLRAHDLRRLGIDEDDIEQEVRIRLWAALERDPAREMPAAYVQKVVLSTIIDAVRRERTRRLELGAEFESVEATHADVGRQPDTLLMQAQMGRQLQECILSLPPRRRRPVQLHLLGYTLGEVGRATGLTLDASSKLIHRGLAELRTMLAEGRHER